MNNKIMLKMATCVAGVLAAFVLCSAVFADRGAIVPVGDVNIEEPAQRAIIAHNGVREILILQTDVKADKETKVVEFMPLPSKPEVSLAQEGCFAALQEIIKTHDLRYVVRYRGRGEDGGESVKVVVAEQLGPHAVTVVKVEDAEAFVTWVREFFAENDLGEPALGDELRRIVADYLDRGLRFFAFDIVTLSPERKTVQPLTYSFRTDHLYYPLKVTSLYGGSGTVELLTLLPDGIALHGRVVSIQPILERPKAPPRRTMRLLRSTSARLDNAEIARLHAGLPALMGNETCTLQAVKYEGPLRFREDVRIPVFHSDPERLCRRFLAALATGDAETIEALVSVPFAYDRKKVISKKEELMAEFEKLFDETRGTSLQPEAISRIVELTSEFDRMFVRQHLGPEFRPNVYRCTIRGEAVLLFLRRVPQGGYKIAGFSD